MNIGIRNRRRIRGGLRIATVAGLAVAASATALAVPAVSALASTSQTPATYPITIRTGGDRAASVDGAATPNDIINAAGGTVAGVNGVVYRVYRGNNTTAQANFVGECTSSGTGANAGRCTVYTGAGGAYTVQQYSAPTGSSIPQDNYFLSPTLGVGSVTATTSSVQSSNYRTINVSVPATNAGRDNGVTVPAFSTAATPHTNRSGHWAVSRYNPMPPAACGRRIALLFDLSASISDRYLADYKTAATAYVDALVGSATSVTMYAFGTTAPLTVSGSPVNPTRAFAMNNPADVTAARNWITSLTRPASQYTNWDRGLWQMTTAARPAGSQPYNEAIMLTDGDPTAMSGNGNPDAGQSGAAARFRNVEAGIFSANRLKSEGTRVVAVGLEAHGTPGSTDNLKAISGPTAGSLSTPEQPGDYFVVPFDELKTLLEEKALADCARLTVTKTANPREFTRVGEVIHYSYTVKNDSPADGFTLNNIRVSDNKVSGITCSPTTLGVGEEATCHGTYRITQADMDRGYVLNTATAHGTTPNGTPVESPPDEEDVAGLQHPGIHVTKQADPVVYTEGTPITYHYTVKNDGNVTLHNVTVTDNRLGAVTCQTTPATSPLTLRPGESATCTSKRYIATLADVEAASIRNEVTAKGTTETNRTVRYKAVEVVNARFTPAIKVTKTAAPPTFHLDTPITYGFTVQNTGDVTLHNVTVLDSRLGEVDCGTTPLTLAPNQSVTCTSKVHDATQADVDAGSIRNVVTATGTGPGGAKPTDKAEQTVRATHAPGIRVTKVVSPMTYTEGTPIKYKYTVQNTGNVTLHNVAVTDNPLGTVDCGPTPLTLIPGQLVTCTGKTHIATTADVAAKHLHNEVTATGTDPSGRPWTDKAEETVIAGGTPGLYVTKEVSLEHYTEGTPLPYTYTVQNIGDVTLTNLTVIDTKVGTISCTPTVLAPGESATCTEATYTADAADVAAGSIHNEVKATGDAPDGTQVDDEAERTVFAETTPGIRVTKEVSPEHYTEGTPLTYTYTVQNTGDVTLSNLSVIDDRFGAVTCTPTVLAPGATATCTDKSHTATAADIAAGSIHNQVTATGTDPAGEPVTDEAERTVFPQIAPAIEVTKTASPRTFDRPGQTITYTYVITNAGDVTLHSVDLTDSAFGDIACPQTVLAPGASMTCIHTHTTTQADVDGGTVANAATATGTAPDGQIVRDDPPEEINAGQASAIEITKSASPAVYSRHGETVTYTYTVANQGNVTLRDVVLSDSRYGTIACPRTVLAPGETMTCTRTHAISATDLDEGSIFNSAAATAQPPSGNRTRSEPANATVRGVAVPAPAPPAPPVPPVVPVTG